MTSVPVDAHRDADVGTLQRRCVVDAVSRHRHRVAVRLQRLDDAQLVGRRDARVDLDRLDLPLELRVGHRVQVGTRDDPARPEQPELGRDRACGEWVVAGDHHRLDPGAGAGADRVLRFRARWVDHPDEAEERHLALRALGARFGPTGDGKDAKRLGGEMVRGFQHGLSFCLAERGLARGREPAGAGAQQNLRCALGVRDAAVGRLVQRRHLLPLGGERDLGDARARLHQLVPLDPRLRRRHDQRRLGRIAADLHASVCRAHEPCVGSERGGAEQLAQRLRRGDRLTVAEELALGLVAVAGDLQRLPGDPDAADGHLVGRQRAGLVAADHRDAAERLDRRQPANEPVSPRHPLRGERERDGHHRGQRLGHDRDRDRDAEHQHLQERLAPEQAERDDHDDDAERHAREDDADSIEALLQRRPSALDRLEHPCDRPELRPAPRGDDEDGPPTVAHRRAGVNHVPAVAERKRGPEQHGGALLDRHRLAGQRRLLDGEVGRDADTAIGRNPVTDCQPDEIAWDELACRNVELAPATHGGGSRRRQLAERLESPLGPVLLQKAQQRREHDDHRDDDRLRLVAEDRRQAGADEQDEDQDVLELLDQQSPRTRLLAQPRARWGRRRTGAARLQPRPARGSPRSRAPPRRCRARGHATRRGRSIAPTAVGRRGAFSLMRRDWSPVALRLTSGVSRPCRRTSLSLRSSLVHGIRVPRDPARRLRVSAERSSRVRGTTPA